MAIRGSRFSSNRNPDANIELGYSEGRLGVLKSHVYVTYFLFLFLMLMSNEVELFL